MKGTVGWYRKDFRLPSAARGLAWIVRFESVNYRTRVWLNGKPIGKHRGAYLPFELRLSPSALRRDGVNRLVVRVDNRRYQTDFPPSGLYGEPASPPAAGGTTAACCARSISARSTRSTSTRSACCPASPARPARANVEIKATVRNYATSARRISVTARFDGRSVRLGGGDGRRQAVRDVRHTRARGRAAAVVAVASDALPGLPDRPLRRQGASATSCGRGSGRSGSRRRAPAAERPPLNFRGVGMHEDSQTLGFAVNNADPRRVSSAVKELGGTLIRSHYPLHPQLQELADREGVMLWSEIPVYAIKTEFLKQRLVRQLAANELRDNILINGNHPSVIVWSIANELASRPGPVQSYYIQRAAAHGAPARPDAPGRHRRRRLPVGRLLSRVRAARRDRHQRVLRLVPRPERPDRGSHAAPAVPRLGARLLPRQGGRGLRVRRRGQPRRAGRGEGNLRVPAGLRPLPPRRDRHEAVDQRRRLLGPPGVPRAARMGGRQPAPAGRPSTRRACSTFAGTPKPAWFDVQQMFKATNQLGGA